MKVIIAMDSFKDCMTSKEAGDSVKTGILSVEPRSVVKVFAISDGGEGFIDAIDDKFMGYREKCLVKDGLGRDIESEFFVFMSAEGKKIAIIEKAKSVELKKLNKEERQVMKTSSYGFGMQIKKAIETGCKEIILTLGGSCTNDAGLGALQALGLKIFKKSGLMHSPATATDLGEIVDFDTAELNKLVKGIKVKYLYDADIDFCGKKGAVQMYASQKGDSGLNIEKLDSDMIRLAEIMERSTGRNPRNYIGVGAAGGAGGGMYSFLNARAERGIDYILEKLDFEKAIEDADFIITGEGSADAQTCQGKAASGVLDYGERKGVEVILLAGGIKDGELLKKRGFLKAIDINSGYPIEENPLDRNVARVRLANAAIKVAEEWKNNSTK